MNGIYAPCLCGSGKKFKFCCHLILKNGGVIPPSSGCCTFPVHECKVLKDWKEIGISPVYISRKMTDNSYIFMSYLVDFWCLGLKDTFLKFAISAADLQEIYRKTEDLQTISYQEARSLVLGAVDFAQRIGLPPDPSWQGIASSFIEAHLDYEKKFSFGKKGKPFYIGGPYDHERYDVQEIIKKLSKVKGDYIVHL